MFEVGFVEIIILAFILLVLFIILKDLFNSKSLDWDEIIKHAINNNATGVLIGLGKAVQIKVENNWRYVNLPEAAEKDIGKLKFILDSQPQSSIWIIDDFTTVNVLRNEENLIELELKTD